MELERASVPGKEIILLGTAHISEKSVEDVRRAVEDEKPDIVGVELDANRLRQLRSGNRWLNTNIGKVISTGQTHLFLLTLLLSNMQRQLGQQLGMKPGMEMLEAMKIAGEKKLPVMLLDRDVNVTLKRAMQRMTLREKIHLAWSVFAGFFSGETNTITREKIERMKEKDVMTQLMQQLSAEMPSVKSVLVDERDAYIAQSIMKSPGKKILAIVGAGHVEGIKSRLGQEVDMASIMRVENKRGLWSYIGYLIPIIFVGLVAALFFTKGTGMTLTALAYWFISTGTLAALGTLLARVHPFSIATAFFAAPFTTLHPLLAAGWFAGAVETKLRNPMVRDFEGLHSLNSLGDFSKNSVTRILLVVAFANLGATIGVIIGFPLVASLLG